jgi:hypothetical protein
MTTLRNAPLSVISEYQLSNSFLAKIFFDTEAATTTCFETYHFPPDFVYPEPEHGFPRRSS